MKKILLRLKDFIEIKRNFFFKIYISISKKAAIYVNKIFT